MHPWFLKNLPLEFMDDGKQSGMLEDLVNESCGRQSIEEISSIIQEARKAGDQGKKVGGQFVGIGSMDLDDMDTDADIDDFETSGDFVCAL